MNTNALPAALVDVLPAHGLEGVGAADEEAVRVVAVLLDHAQVVLALAHLLALKEIITNINIFLWENDKNKYFKCIFSYTVETG